MSDDISLLNQEQGYKVPFFVDHCRLADDISLFKQDHMYKVPFFVDYSTNNRNRQNRIIDIVDRIINFYFVDYSNNIFLSILGLY